MVSPSTSPSGSSRPTAQHKDEEAKAALEKVSFDKEEIARLDKEISKVDEDIHERMLKTPNIPDDSLPIGIDDTYNRPEKYVGKPTTFTFKPKSHWELGLEMLRLRPCR